MTTKVSLTRTRGLDIDKAINMRVYNNLKNIAPDYPRLGIEVKLDPKFTPWDGALLVAAVKANIDPEVFIARFGSEYLIEVLHTQTYTHAAAQLKLPMHMMMRIATKTKLPDAALSLGVGVKLVELLCDDAVLEVQEVLRSIDVRGCDFYINFVDLMEW
jgi:hypothetical protein